MMNNITLDQAASLLASWDDILIITHSHPDADTLGSAFALKYAFPQKNIRVLCEDEIPMRLRFVCKGFPTDMPSRDYAHVVALDCAETELMGERVSALYGKKIELKIDHHRTSVDFAVYNYTDDNAAACGEIIYDIIEKLGKMNTDAASALYAAIASDTGCFKYRNVSARTHEAAAALIRTGIDFADINSLLFENKSKAEITAMKLALNSLEFYLCGRVAVISFSNKIKQENGICDDDLSCINGLGREIEGVELSVVIKEKSGAPGEYKISMRSGPSVDCSEICARFGGGGHLRAAGAQLKAADEKEASEIIMKAATEIMGNE